MSNTELAEYATRAGAVPSVNPPRRARRDVEQPPQAPGYVTIVNEMMHEARIVPLDGRQHTSAAIGSHLGDSRGRWEGDTLVVETKNVADRLGLGMNNTGASAALTITERFTRTSDATLRYLAAVDDPLTWTAPFTMQLELERDDNYGMFEYACHEGNHALRNILSGARATEGAAGNAAARPPR